LDTIEIKLCSKMKLAISKVALLVGATILCSFQIQSTLAVETSNEAVADEEDAEFWERFLGQAYKRPQHRKTEIMSMPPTP
jgi:hypothetical protein